MQKPGSILLQKENTAQVSEQGMAFQHQQLKRMGEFHQAAAEKKREPRRVIDFYELGVERPINYSQGNRDGRFLGHFSQLRYLARLSHNRAVTSSNCDLRNGCLNMLQATTPLTALQVMPGVTGRAGQTEPQQTNGFIAYFGDFPPHCRQQVSLSALTKLQT